VQADDDEPEIDVKEVEIRFMMWLLMQQDVTSDADIARKIWGWDRLAGWKHRHFNRVKAEAINRIESEDATLLPHTK